MSKRKPFDVIDELKLILFCVDEMMKGVEKTRKTMPKIRAQRAVYVAVAKIALVLGDRAALEQLSQIAPMRSDEAEY
jgi:hypothetical protein